MAPCFFSTSLQTWVQVSSDPPRERTSYAIHRKCKPTHWPACRPNREVLAGTRVARNPQLRAQAAASRNTNIKIGITVIKVSSKIATKAYACDTYDGVNVLFAEPRSNYLSHYLKRRNKIGQKKYILLNSYEWSAAFTPPAPSLLGL